MPATIIRSPWDFSEAFQLLSDLPGQKDRPQRHAAATSAQLKLAFTPQRQSNGLGDFSEIFEYLKITTDPPKPLAPSPFKEAANSELDTPDPNRPPPPGAAIKDEAYASDGAVYTKKSVRFNDDADVFEATDSPGGHTSEDVVGPSSPSKRERKREKRAALKEKRKAINAAKIAKPMNKKQLKAVSRLKSASDVESEADIRKLKKPTPARKASVHSQLPATLKKVEETPRREYNLRSKVAAPRTPTPGATLPSAPIPIVSTSGVAPTKGKKKNAQVSSANSSPAKSLQKMSLLDGHLVPGPITPKIKKVENKAPETPQAYIALEENNTFFSSLQFPPSTLQASAHVTTSPKQAKRGAPTFTIWPKEDRDLQLFFRLVRDFPEDKAALAQPVHLANHTSTPNGIHVFVDFSNIWIGFMEYLKYLPKPPGLRIPHQNLSFDSLVLFLERRRAVGKRVLAGSLPLLPAMELAKAIGYETNILDKVYKARGLSEKQKRYLVQNSLRRGNSASAVSGRSVGGIVKSGYISNDTETCVTTAIPLFSNATGAVIGDPVTPKTTVPSGVQMSPEKWVEQGVDEILHLKILESIVDTDEPSTMVVATGDAAKAEYSEGFMKMIVRALKKGWKVELVAWGKSISMDYRRPEFTNMWVGRFRIIELDQYAEYLLDT